jgi:hypothetical protein
MNQKRTPLTADWFVNTDEIQTLRDTTSGISLQRPMLTDSESISDRLNEQVEPGTPKIGSPLTRLMGQRYWIEHADALDVMRALPNESVDIIATEPPYGVNYQLGLPVDKRKTGAGDKQPFIWWLHDAYRATKQDGALFVMCRSDVQDLWKTAITIAGFTVRSHLIWDRVEYTTATSGMQSFPQQHDVIWFATKGKALFETPPRGTIVRVPRIPMSAMLHPNEKPVGLWQDLLDPFAPNLLVVDPFAGSASAGEASLRIGHRFLGVERELSYVTSGMQRLETIARTGKKHE